MKIILNKTTNTFQHSLNDAGSVISLTPNEKKEVPDEVADLWLRYEGVELISDLNLIAAKDAEIAELKSKLGDEKEDNASTLNEIKNKSKK